MARIRREEAFILVMGLLTSGLVWLLATGCEDNTVPDQVGVVPDVGRLVVEPGSKTLASNDTFAVFSVSGGMSPYTWSVSDPSIGDISAPDAAAVTYNRVAGSNGVNILIVRDKNEWTATATIIHE